MAAEKNSPNDHAHNLSKSASSPLRSPGENGHGSDDAPKAKRRKVSRACVYCRRSHMTCDANRPCLRCVKRDIGHWCRDEPREPSKRKSISNVDDNGNASQAAEDPSIENQPIRVDQVSEHGGVPSQNESEPILEGANKHSQSVLPTIKAPVPVSTAGAAQNPFYDMHSLHPSNLFNAPEVGNEYNLLNDFLSSSVLDDGGIFEDAEGLFGGSLFSTGNATPNLTGQQSQPASSSLMLPPGAQATPSITRPTSTVPTEKAKEAYYMTAADPSGNERPEVRMNKLLQAKYDAGLLKPFNYVRGYAKLNKYMEQHMQPSNRQKILRQLDMFRPKFRERMQSLTDVELILVEMWFERCLMEYDRVFASMAVPACCWRRTGEIFRGNKEMAELINVPVEELRDGKLAIHEIIVEEYLVDYWEQFGSIAFDRERKGMLTRCALKNPDSHPNDAVIACCFSFTIRRDEHNIPSLIVGNFLPKLPSRDGR